MAKPRVEQAAERLWQYIIDNDMEVGEKLPNEYELAEVLEVGRSTVREAVRILAGRNILEVRQGSGTYISSKKGIAEDPLGFTLVKDRLKLTTDLFELRYLLEPRIAERAAQFATDEEIEKLEEVVIAIEKSFELNDGKHQELDVKFHTMLAEMSGNIAMTSLAPIINDSIRLINEDYASHRMTESSLKAHRNILYAVKDRHPIAAYDSMLGHVLEVRQTVIADWSNKHIPTHGLRK
ncbi:FadR family transcriptional regulator [Tuanshanicoccus lijuaniae]|uniref:FadR/GntR family transcriptional regulator n=1 Tax=Aerococcaceae bacterium zg-1292 TaxID=2774330 RepID=UPI0019364B9E|nr:FadR family transcriptional regulator [Aerococcaceae bacterium zg-1292]QQA37113.1 FadR family transcriptional regulator [Aerococcaceae bacterium zg-1292]